MAVRTTIDIPGPLHEKLRHRSEQSGTSIRSLIIRAIEQTYTVKKTGNRVSLPLIKRGGKRGPLYPTDENPYDVIFP